jgi:hypothetical protein
MVGLGLGVSFFGYWVLYYGITQVQGGNWGFLDLGLPSRAGKLASIPTDGPSSQGSDTGGTKAAAMLNQHGLPGGGAITVKNRAGKIVGKYGPPPIH